MTEQVEQFLDRLTQFDGEVLKGTKSVADLSVKSNESKKRSNDIVHENTGLRARLQQSQHGQNNLNGNIIRM